MGNFSTPSIVAASSAFNGIKKDVTISNISGDTYDPNTGKRSTGTIVTKIPKGKVSNYSEKIIAESGGLITKKDKKVVLMSNEIDFDINEKTKITIGGQLYSVIEIKQNVTENEIILQIRR